MHFTLTYRGPLTPEQQGVRDEKYLIRRQIHPQLRQWWKDCRPLKHYWDTKKPVPRRTNAMEVGPPYRPGIEYVADDFASFGYRWVPLVRKKQHWACSL